ncbi:lipoprotein insertase outer membrane protein LolB [Marinobacteraceae bacterium S3BR75-40.1]
MGSRASLGWLVPLLALLVAGCASAPPEPPRQDLSATPPGDWTRQAEALQAFDHWRLTGKIAVHQGDDDESAVINRWEQSGRRFDVQLSSAFLGLGTTRVQGTRDAIWLTNSDGETFYSDNPEQLMFDATGWHLPLGALIYWVRGIPAPGGDSQRWFTPEGQLARFNQNGWTVRVNRHKQWIPDLPALPRLITLTRDDIRIRLAVTQWQPNA